MVAHSRNALPKRTIRRARLPAVTASDWAVLVFQAAAGSLGYTVALVYGLRYASAADASVITGLMPVATGAVAVLALGAARYAVVGVGTTVNGGPGVFVTPRPVAHLSANLNGGDDALALVDGEGQRLLGFKGNSGTSFHAAQSSTRGESAQSVHGGCALTQ